MYSKDFVVAILHNGKFCEENKSGVVALPFNSEYTIRLRNKNNRRALARVYIDEENVSEGGIVVSPNSYVDIERSVGKAVKFKFVSSNSSEAIDQGKNNREDGSNGVIRVEWKLEKEFKPVYTPRTPTWVNPYKHDIYGGVCGQSFNASEECVRGLNANVSDTLAKSGVISTKSLSEGCTVDGGYSNQTFTTTYFDEEYGSAVVIRLILKGYTTHEGLSHENYCANCGTRVGQKANFCRKCGNKLK